MPESTAKKPAKVETNAYSLLAARFWHGMTPSVLAGIFRQGKYRNVSLPLWGMVGTAWFAALMHAISAARQRRKYGDAIAKTEIKPTPIFIIGHWRSGTTLLHEYMSLDDRLTSPTTYECFAPAHCFISGPIFKPLKFLLPAKRPMDNMPAGWERPQEDEFALMALGQPSPYRRIAFPNNPPVDMEYLDFVGVSDEARRAWQDALRNFLKLVAYRSPDKQIVLKSPTHLGRVAVLNEMYPDAKFIHIVRDPYKVYPSTVKLWKALDKFQAFQFPKHKGLEEYVFECFERMYRQFESDRTQLTDDRLHEIRYEDLVANPVEQIERIYQFLGMSDFDSVLPKLQDYLSATKDYQTNKFSLDETTRAEIDRRWGHWMRRHGYCGG